MVDFPNPVFTQNDLQPQYFSHSFNDMFFTEFISLKLMIKLALIIVY